MPITNPVCSGWPSTWPQAAPAQVACPEDRALFADVAQALGLSPKAYRLTASPTKSGTKSEYGVRLGRIAGFLFLDFSDEHLGETNIPGHIFIEGPAGGRHTRPGATLTRHWMPGPAIVGRWRTRSLNMQTAKLLATARTTIAPRHTPIFLPKWFPLALPAEGPSRGREQIKPASSARPWKLKYVSGPFTIRHPVIVTIESNRMVCRERDGIEFSMPVAAIVRLAHTSETFRLSRPMSRVGEKGVGRGSQELQRLRLRRGSSCGRGDFGPDGSHLPDQELQTLRPRSLARRGRRAGIGLPGQQSPVTFVVENAGKRNRQEMDRYPA